MEGISGGQQLTWNKARETSPGGEIENLWMEGPKLFMAHLIAEGELNIMEKKLFRRTAAVAAAAMLSLSLLGGCSGNSGVTNLDEEALAEELKSTVAFEDQLEPVDEDLALSLYGLTDEQVDSMEVYMGTGAKAEEIAVMEAAEGTDVSVLEEAANHRVESLRTDFVDYIPEEMPKLEDPVIVTSGDYVILCVSGDNEGAQKVIDGYVK